MFVLNDEWRRYIAKCAERWACNYDEREDLVSDTVTALLEYDEHIEHPRSFIRTTIRNLAINRRAVGAGAREMGTCIYDTDPEDISQPDPPVRIIIHDTLERLLQSLTPSESRCYQLLRDGNEQRDLPRLLGVSRQAVSKLLARIRSKFEALEDLV